MKFGIFYEHQLPKPWAPGDEAKMFHDALEQVILADRLGYDDIIDPRDLRDALLRGLALTDNRVPAGPVLTGGITP